MRQLVGSQHLVSLYLISIVLTMHLRLLMAQVLIVAVNRGMDLQELDNLHLVNYSILTILGPLPSLSSCLELFRTSAASVAWCSPRTWPIELPPQLGELAIPGHPCEGAEMRSFEAFRFHAWVPWMLTNLRAATTTCDYLVTSAEQWFPRPYGPQEQTIINWLRDAQLTIRNVLLFLRLSGLPSEPGPTPTVTTQASRTPELWGE